MSETGMIISWIVSLAVRHRGAVTVISAFLILAAAWLSFSTPTRLDMDDFLPVQEGTEGPFFGALKRHLPNSGRIIVYVESDVEMSAVEAGPIMDTLAEKLGKIEGVTSVIARMDPRMTRFFEEEGPERFFLYLRPAALELVAERLSRPSIEEAFNRARSPRDSSLAIFGDVQLRDPLRLAVMAARTVYEMAGSSPIQLVDGYFSLPGNKKFFLIVQPNDGADDLDVAARLVEDIESVFQRFEHSPTTGNLLEGKSLSAIGRPISYVSAYDAVSSDIRKVGIAATIAILILLALFFRNLLAPIIVALPIIFGLAVSGLVALIVFGSISLIAWIFAGVLVGLGVDFGLHIVSHYRLHTEPGTDRTNALQSALERPGRSIAFSASTTAAAFFSLSVISYPVMTQIAVLTGVGLLSIFVGSFTIMVPALSYMKPGLSSKTGWERWSSFWTGASARDPKTPVFLWIAFLIAATIASSTVPFEPHPWKLALKGNPKTAELNRLNDELGASFTPIYVVSEAGTRGEAIARDRAAVQILQRGAQRARIVSIESISNWLPAQDRQELNIEYVKARPNIFSPERFRRDYDQVFSAAVGSGWEPENSTLEREYPETIARFLTPNLNVIDLDELQKAGLQREMDRFLVEDDGKYFATSYVYLRQFPWAEGSIDRFLETYNMLGGNELEGVYITGDALRSATHSSVLRRDLFLATMLSLILVLGILWVQFRQMSRVMLCLLPAICGLAAAFLVMAVMQIELNLLTLAIAPIIIGIGVDDGIHIVQRLHTGQSFRRLFREAGSGMTMTTLTTVSAFACLGIASYDGIREMGIVGAIALITCLLASLHLVPAWYRLMNKDH